MTAETLPLIQTKLHRPPAQPDLVVRPRLLNRLDAHWRDRPLTLISAPAGYGKSVLASMWLESCGCPSGWVSLDETDNDLHTFTSYLLAAIKMSFPDISFQSQALLETPSPPPAPLLARHLVKDLDQIDKPFILALDDIHVIHEQAILDLLTELLKHPPRAMHLALVGRQDPALPVTSLRAYQLITEIRLSDLRFTTSDTVLLLKRQLHRDVSEDIAAKWAERTEGWVTALHLAALSLRHRQATVDSDAPIPLDSRYLQDYLLVEVLTKLPPENQNWLLKTSLLDRFCAPLCEAVCQVEGESLNGQAFMSWLQKSNLFLIPLDDRGEWFRFHHLFQSQLQNLLERQFDRENMAAIHKLASRWFAQYGWIDEAIQHVLVARDMPAAVELVAQNRYQLMNHDDWNRLERWLNWFPVEVKNSDLMLALTEGHLALMRGRVGDVLLWRERTETMRASMPGDSGADSAMLGEMASLSAFANAMIGEAASAVQESTEALRLLPRQALHVRTMALGSLGLGQQMSGEIDRDVAIFRDTLADPGWPSYARAKLLLLRSIAHFMAGDLAGTQLLARESLQLATKNSLWDTVGFARYFLGVAHYLRNELAQAASVLLTQIDDKVLTPPTPLTYAACALVRIYNSRQQPDRASEILQLVTGHLNEIGNSAGIETLHTFQIELALEQGNLDKAGHLSQIVDFERRPPSWYHHIPQLTPIKLLLAKKTAPDLENALLALEQFDRQMRKIHRITIRIEVLALQALVHDARGDRQMASDKLSTALRLAEPGGFIRNFVDLGPPMADLLARLHEQGDSELVPYISRILAVFQMEERSPTASDLEKPLTKREMETLRLLATDLSQKEIASEMTISLATMRTHARNMYQKLGVNSRFEAVQRAKELGLI